MSDFLKINVSEHIEKKGGLAYLSWAWAWAEVLKLDPAARFEVRTFNGYPVCMLGETAMVCVEVVIKSICRECWLPVMDNRNNAVKNPDSRKISDAIMRCMVKAIAMHGLGLYVYAGEDLPEGDEGANNQADKRKAELEELALYMIDCHQTGKEVDAIRIWYDPKTFPEIEDRDTQEERKYIWSLMKNESKLRAIIKSNKPE